MLFQRAPRRLPPEQGTLVPTTEALIMTVDNGGDLALRMPIGVEPSPQAKLLLACFFRYNQGDEAWLNDMAAWAEKTISDKALAK